MTGHSMATVSGSGRCFLPYEVPLADGDSAHLVLPVDLTPAEADRICGVIQALAFGQGSDAP